MTPATQRHNNFDLLRVAAALMVIHGHGWVLAGFQGPGLWGVPFARVGLDVFFSISGYLVTASWDRTPLTGEFFSKRALRIFPGLVACVVLTIAVLGPMTTRLPLAAYATDPLTFQYAANIALLNELFLPGVFAGLRERGAVNGSLWSLLPEFVCYLTVPLIALAPRSRRPILLAALGALIGGAGLYLFYGYDGPPPRLYHVDLKYAFVEVPFFFGGSALHYLERRWGESLWRADVSLLFFSGNYVISTWFDWWNIPFEWFTLPYMVICFGRSSLVIVREAGRFGDLSYGLYLYAFPMQQVVLTFFPQAAYPVLLCTGLTVPLALLSWFAVERPALRFRSWGRTHSRRTTLRHQRSVEAVSVRSPSQSE